MDLEAGASARSELVLESALLFSDQAQVPLQRQTSKEPAATVRPEFFVIVADSSSQGARRPTVLAPPDPAPKDTTDWGFFWLGWIFQPAWVLGCFRPLFRYPYFPQTQNFKGWLANVIGTAALITIAIVIVIIVLR